MARPTQSNTPQSRDRADAWLRRSTRAAVLGATGVAALIGIVVAQEHPGASSTSGSSSGGTGTSSTSGTSGSSSSSGDESDSSGISGNTGTGSSSSSTGSTGNTGNTGSSFTPSISNSSPSVTSGGSSHP